MLCSGEPSGEQKRIAPSGAPTRAGWSRARAGGWRLRRLLAAFLTVLALWLALDAGYIHAKAQLAQVLLSRAWEANRVDGLPHRPWPWADSHPVARLQMPRLGVDQIVLAGDSGRTIAFAPGWAEASAAPGSAGTSVISAHRDTHFAWLRELVPGDELILQSASGSQRYRITLLHVADTRSERLALESDGNRLLLVTCWPFDAVRSGGPLRYVAEAEPVIEAMPAASRWSPDERLQVLAK
jgi:sortase A